MQNLAYLIQKILYMPYFSRSWGDQICI